MDFQTARMLGVRANRVIGVAVLLSGALAAVVAVMLTVQNPLVTPDFALRDTIIVLAGVVLGGMNRPIPATLGGFAIGFASGAARRRAADEPEPVPADVPLRRRDPRPARAARRALHARAGGGARMRRLLGAAGARRPGGARDRRRRSLGTRRLDRRRSRTSPTRSSRSRSSSRSTSSSATRACSRSGTSASSRVGAWTAGVLSVPVGEKPAIMPNLAHCPARPHDRQPHLARARRASSAAICALVVALPLMRLSGLAAGIATFGVLEITHNLLRYEEKIGPGLNTFSSVPETTGAAPGGDRRARRDRRRVRLRRAAASAACCARRARTPAAARAVGVSVYRQRLDRVHALRPARRARRRPLRAPAAA